MPTAPEEMTLKVIAHILSLIHISTFLPCDKIQRWNFLHQILHVAIQRTRKAKQRFCLCFVDVLLSLFVLLDGTRCV